MKYPDRESLEQIGWWMRNRMEQAESAAMRMPLEQGRPVLVRCSRIRGWYRRALNVQRQIVGIERAAR